MDVDYKIARGIIEIIGLGKIVRRDKHQDQADKIRRRRDDLYVTLAASEKQNLGNVLCTTRTSSRSRMAISQMLTPFGAD